MTKGLISHRITGHGTFFVLDLLCHPVCGTRSQEPSGVTPPVGAAEQHHPSDTRGISWGFFFRIPREQTETNQP